MLRVWTKNRFHAWRLQSDLCSGQPAALHSLGHPIPHMEVQLMRKADILWWRRKDWVLISYGEK